MLFNSVTFILFFVYILIVHYSRLPWGIKKGHLLFGSYLFYAAWNPPFVILLFLSTLIDWNLAKKIHACQSDKIRKYWLWLSLIFNLGMLSIFKYSGFLIENFETVLTGIGMDVKFTDPGFILPMGISFYTFQTLSYTIDVYYRKLKPHHGFLDYALFVSFFPQLVAGPIVRAKTFLPQLQKQNHINFNVFSTGISLFIIGIFAKTVLADAFYAPLVNTVFVDNVQPDLLSSWLAGLFFYGQIFCDFAGYSLCAIGVALCLGFTLPYNFNSPFAAVGFSDFWRRWHISLSSWLRDYLYIPLGGNRLGSFNTFRNLMITMLLGGLWHGAAWTFVIWGGLHGFYLMAERWLKSLFASSPIVKYKIMQFIFMLITFFCVMLAFVLFRAEDLPQAFSIVMGLFSMQENQALIKWDKWTQVVSLSFVLLFLCQRFYKNSDMHEVIARMPVIIRSVLLALALILILISSGDSDAFIYFQF